MMDSRGLQAQRYMLQGVSIIIGSANEIARKEIQTVIKDRFLMLLGLLQTIHNIHVTSGFLQTRVDLDQSNV